MEKFKKDALNHFCYILSALPPDAILYGKPETFLNSSLASLGNRLSCSEDYYYKTEYSKIDIVRLTQEGSKKWKVDFMLESKFFYFSDWEKKFGTRASDIAYPENHPPNYPEGIISKAIYQLQKYKQNLNDKEMLAKKDIDLCIFINFLFFPHGSNNKYYNNSGLKYINKKRLKYDQEQWKQWQCDLNKVINDVCRKVDKSFVITHPDNCVKVTIRYKDYFTFISSFGFPYYLLSVAVTI